MKEKMQKVIGWLPATFTALAGLITVIVVAATGMEADVTDYLSVLAGVAFIVLLTLFNRLFRLRITLFALALTSAHVFLSINCGTALGVYELLPWWDLFVHGMFGAVCCSLLVCLYGRFTGMRPNWFVMIVLFFVTVGFAGLWEVYEYTAGLLLHRDMQCVEAALAAGLNPLQDTISDIAIALAGVALFYLFYFLDVRFFRGRMYGIPRKSEQTSPLRADEEMEGNEQTESK